MTREGLRESYTETRDRHEASIGRHNKLLNLLSVGRLALLVATVYMVVLGIKQDRVLFFLIAALGVVIFFYLIGIYIRQKDLRQLYTRLKDLNKKELKCLDHDFHDLPGGEEFADTSHPWSHDLDLFGKGSLYQYLNRTNTFKGSQLLAHMLCTEASGETEVRERQARVEDLKSKMEFRQLFTARGSMIEEEAGDLPGIEKWLNETSYIRKYPWLFYLALLVSGLSLFIIGKGIFDPSAFNALLPVLLFNFFVLSFFLARSNRYQQSISKKHLLLEGYARLLRILSEHEFKHEQNRRDCISAREGMKEIRRLSRLLNIFDQRLNMLLGVLFNGFFLFDFIMLFFLERWKKRNRSQVRDWLRIIGETDTYVSLAGFSFNHPDFCLPQLEDNADGLLLEELGHPLIPDAKRVSNSLEIADEKVVIITGANMAGKSTFLRSLGINTVLAYTGCPVCASKFSMGFAGLFSSMRTADSLADEESYFLAEIKKLQRIVQRMETGTPLLILLDEVLKGTNTTDKKKGSVGLIKRALSYPVRCFIATHDLSLGEMESEVKGVVNYCFESYIRDLKLDFDYRIRKGIATNMNASFLMKKMGIME